MASYKTALPPDRWPDVHILFKMISTIHNGRREKRKIHIDLTRLKEAYQKRGGVGYDAERPYCQ